MNDADWFSWHVKQLESSSNAIVAEDAARFTNQSHITREEIERARCIEAIRTTLANWRCVPSQATREFAELCIREIEK